MTSLTSWCSYICAAYFALLQPCFAEIKLSMFQDIKTPLIKNSQKPLHMQQSKSSLSDLAPSEQLPNAASLFFQTFFEEDPKQASFNNAHITRQTPYQTDVTKIYQLIERAESGKASYNAVHGRAKIKPPKAPTDMTLGEIYKWIAQTPRQPHAIGRYQFIPKTLKALAQKAGLNDRTRFSKDTQDRLAYLLLQDAGIEKMRAGEMGKNQFMLNLAKIWAGFPTKTGRSYYDGHAGNKATMSWQEFKAQIHAIFPS